MALGYTRVEVSKYIRDAEEENEVFKAFRWDHMKTCKLRADNMLAAAAYGESYHQVPHLRFLTIFRRFAGTVIVKTPDFLCFAYAYNPLSKKYVSAC